MADSIIECGAVDRRPHASGWEETTTASTAHAGQSFKTLLRRLSKAGFERDFVQRAVLPDWWDERCADDPRLVQDIEIRVARFLGLSISAVSDSRFLLETPRYPGAQLRRVRDTDGNRLAPATHAAIRCAAAVVRNLRDSVPPPKNPPGDGLAWRDRLMGRRTAPSLEALAEHLWELGIPVVPLDVLPAPNFQGMACIVDDRPVILLGHKHDEPGRVAFVIAHEAGHIAAGDCAAGRPIVDEEPEIADDGEMERNADRYATRVLVGEAGVPQLDDTASMQFKDLAGRAREIERTKGVDAGFVIFAWAHRTGDYATAAKAVKALYRNTGARKKLHRLLNRHVNFTTAAETDRSLLLCTHGGWAHHEPAR